MARDARTPDQEQVLNCVRRWLRIRNAAGDPQLIADIDHSALLERLLDGQEPLPEPPPRAYSYPWYALIERGELQVDDVSDLATHIVICQHRWEIERRAEDGSIRVQAGATHAWLKPVGPKAWRLTVIPKEDRHG
jgi:hypothetical protein